MKKLIVKIGGKIAAEHSLVSKLIADIAKISNEYSVILVHGGGAEVSSTSAHFGITPEFKDGVRITGSSEMKIVDAILSGKINKEMVRLFHKGKLKAVGLSGSDGSIFTGEAVSSDSRTGKVTAVDSELLELLMSNNYVPVIASTSMCSNYEALNINADEAALAIAQKLSGAGLIFISDIKGVLKDGSVISYINESIAEKEIESGVIQGGMIPKVRSSLSAIDAGAEFVTIGTFEQEGDLIRLVKNEIGTKISK
ncbi:MAG: acetylglutamate kinase [Spirochaetales bacterium]|nr:acetylglutamate kinase [Spirochaetales bacterium]